MYKFTIEYYYEQYHTREVDTDYTRTAIVYADSLDEAKEKIAKADNYFDGFANVSFEEMTEVEKMSEKKYIDRELLINEICKNRLMSKELAAQRILHIINEQPTVDIGGVQHGMWIKREKEGGIFANYECSVCSAYPTYGIRSYYCPNCGAKMRGDCCPLADPYDVCPESES